MGDRGVIRLNRAPAGAPGAWARFLAAAMVAGLGPLCVPAPAAAEGPMECRLLKFTSSYRFDCQVAADFVTFEDITFNDGGCPSLKELYRNEGRLKFGAVPPEIGKVFRSGDQFSLTVAFTYCPNLTELTARVDGQGYTWQLR